MPLECLKIVVFLGQLITMSYGSLELVKSSRAGSNARTQTNILENYYPKSHAPLKFTGKKLELVLQEIFGRDGAFRNILHPK